MDSESGIHPCKKKTESPSATERRESVLRVDAHVLPDVGRTLTASLQARVGGSEQQHPVLMDSGATHSVMDKNMYERIRRPEHPALSPYKVAFRSAFEGAPENETLGLWSNIPIEIGGVEYRANFHIHPAASVPIIIGMDFLVEHHAEIKCGVPAMVRLRAPPRDPPVEVKTVPSGAKQPKRIAVMMEQARVSLGPYDQRFVNVQLVDSPSTDCTMIFESMTDLNSSVLVPPQLVSVHQGQAALYVENRSVNPVAIDTRFLGCASEVGVGDATSRHPGANAIYKPTARLQEGERKRGSKCARTSPSVYGFLHERDIELVRRGAELDNQPIDPEAWDLQPERPTDPSSMVCQHSVTGGFTENTPSPGECESDRSRRGGVRGLTGTVGSERNNSGGEETRSRLATRPEGPTSVSVVSTADAGLPDYLRDMLPPVTGGGTPTDHANLRALVKEYEDIFIKPGGEVGWTDRTTHVIDVGDAKPVKIPPRKTSFAEKELIERTVYELLRSGKIRDSCSPWASPIVLVKKKDGTMRFCIDYRRLNDATVKDAYPLPRIEDALDHLTGSKYFSTLDLASAYWQVAMDDASVDKTAFATHIGLFEWLVMPFGLSNAPATCERLMESLFKGYQWNGVLVYLDDLVAYGQTWDGALKITRMVFQELREANLKLKPSKCFLMREEVDYLGHRVTGHGVYPGASKVEAVRHWPAPATVDEVRSFLGLTGYYRKFVKDYAEKAVPLTMLLKKDVKFFWDQPQQLAYEQLRKALIEYPCLGTIQRTGRLILDTDASDYALGAVLQQEQDGVERVLGYYSKSLNLAQTRYCTTKKELLAIKAGLETWDHYLQNPSEPFLIRTDHAALKWLTTMSSHDRTLLRWATFISEYQYECEHRPGRHHTNADALSRVKIKPCGYKDCPDCSPTSTTFAFAEGEDTRLREHAELVIAPPEKKTSFLVAAITRSQTANQTPTPETKPDNPAFNTRSQTRLESAAATGGESGTQRAPVVERSPSRSPCRSPVEVGQNSGSDSAQPLPVSSTCSGSTSSEGLTSGNNGRRRGRRRQPKLWVEESLELSDPQRPQEIGGEWPEELKAEQAEAPLPGERAKQDGRTGLSSYEREAMDIPLFDDATCRKEITEWARRDWAVAQSQCPHISRVLVYVQKGRAPRPEEVTRESREVKLLLASLPLFELKDAVLLYNTPVQNKSEIKWQGRVVVPQSARVELVRFVHRLSAHLSERRVYPLLRERFWWNSMGTDVRAWLRCCDLCQQIKPGDKRGRYPLAQEGYGAPLDRVGIDISGPWPVTEGRSRYILATTDYFSKWLELDGIPDKSARSVAKALHRFVSRYGVMFRLHSDRGTEFTAAVTRHLCEFLGARRTYTSGHAPWSNAQVERGNRTVRAMLQALTREHGIDWDECLPYVMQAYNGTVHASTGFTPHQLMHSQCDGPRLPLDMLLNEPKDTLMERDVSCYSSYVEEQRAKIQGIHALVRERLGRSAEAQSRQHEKAGLRPHQYQPGSEVWYYYPANVTSKLESPWVGPYKVLATDLTKNMVKVTLRGKPRWINGANVKPVRRLANGDFL